MIIVIVIQFEKKVNRNRVINSQPDTNFTIETCT